MSGEPDKVIIERSSTGVTAILALVLMAMVGLGIFALSQSEANKENAFSAAAESVGDAADQVGAAAEDVSAAATDATHDAS